MISIEDIKEFLKLNDLGYLHHREGQTLEFKEQFNFAGLAEYFRDFAAFSNNKGGYLVFGVSDSPRKLIGMSESSSNQFEKIDPEKISGFLNDIFSGIIDWEQQLMVINGLNFGIFRIYQSENKPIIAKKDEGKDQIIRNGEIYFRYGGRTQKIQYSELQSIINYRLGLINKHWIDLMSKIAKAGPQNAAILDTEKSLIEKSNNKIMVVDNELAGKLKYIKEGQFSEKERATTLKLVGDVVPIEKVEVIKKVKEDLIKEYPISAMELIKEVKSKVPDCRQQDIYEIIKENDLKDNKDYSARNFRSKKHEDHFKETGEIPSSTPNIYNNGAVDFIVKILNHK